MNLYIRYFKDFCIRKKDIIMYILIILIIMFSTFVTIKQPVLQAELIDELGSGNINIGNKLLIFLLLVILGYCSNCIITLLTKIISEDMAYEMRERISDKLSRIESGFYKKNSFSDLLAKSEKDINNIKECGVTGVIFVCSNLISIIACIPCMIKLNLKIGITNTFLLMLIPLLNYLYKRKLEAVGKNNIRDYIELNKTFMDAFDNWENTRLFGNVSYVRNKFGRDNQNYKNSTIRQNIIYIENSFINILLQVTGISIIWIVGVLEIGQSKLSIGKLMALTSYHALMSGPMTTISSYISEFRTAKVALEDIYSFWDSENEWNAQEIMNEAIHSIEVNNVSFSYNGKASILDNASMVFERGKIYALSGRSGVGKSTMLDIITGIIPAYSGEILINGKNIKSFNLESYRKQISFVKQNSVFYKDSIYNNLILAKSRREMSVEKACEEVGILEEINQLENNWDTLISDNSNNLSVGQAKRLDIARNILKESSLYIFDEATAAIDTTKRELFYHLIKDLSKNAIVILISHNIEDFEHVDIIYEFTQAEIKERRI